DDTQSDDARDDRVDRARAALRSLPEAQRTALELSLLHGRTHDEIAKAMNTPLGTVKSHIRRGLQRARALLQQSDARHRASDVAREQQGS
uniref:sigma factor-like helix-turn-helix DNA-binding protein n=1 Tax=Gemmatimonas sp. TaxID=1962908 RepID=UPI0035658902